MEQNNLFWNPPSLTPTYNAARLKDLLDVFDASVKHPMPSMINLLTIAKNRAKDET
jgi:hypothetical protein